MKARLAILVALALPLAACVTTGGGSISGGECKVMQRPPYVVQGKAAYDQNWIDNEIEGGIGACGWKRPAARPAELDGKPARRPAPKKGLAARIKEKAKSIWPAASTVPLAPLPRPVEAEPAPKPVEAPPPPRAAIDELLNPLPARKVYP